MSASQKQCNQAKVFIQVYRQAIQIIEQTAKRQKMKQSYENFLDKVINWQKEKIEMNDDLFREIRIFQFSQYFFMKNIPHLHQCDSLSKFLGTLNQVKAENIQK